MASHTNALLSIREEHILFAIADGLTNPEIARELGLSEQTISVCAGALFEKLGARNRTHAVALAYHRGILKPREVV